MEIIPPSLRIYQQILKDLENAFPFLNVPKAKAEDIKRLQKVIEKRVEEIGRPLRIMEFCVYLP